MVGIRTNYRLKSNTDHTHLGIKLEEIVSALQEGVKDRGTLLERRIPQMTKPRYLSFRRIIKILQGLIVTFGLFLFVLEKLLQVLASF
jgi:hypothetical protein